MAAVTGSEAPETLTGTGAADTILGLGGDDAAYGHDGNDFIDGGRGDDFLYGGSGVDLLIGGAGEDFLFGQSGTDTASYASAAAGLTLDLTDTFLSTGDARGDFFFSVEIFFLTNLDDGFFGTLRADIVQTGPGADRLAGLGGDDLLVGNDGDDLLEGGQGADRLNGGPGSDTATYIGSSAGLTIDVAVPGLTTGDAVGDVFLGIERIRMSEFDDILRLSGAFHQGDGGAGNDQLFGDTGADILIGGTGNDRLTGGSGNDRLEGGDDGDDFFGGGGADQFFGGNGSDTVFYRTNVRVDLSNPGQGQGEARGDSFAEIEAVGFVTGRSTFVGGISNLSISCESGGLTCLAGTGAELFINRGGQLLVSYARAQSGVGLVANGALLTGTGGAAGDGVQLATDLTLGGFADTVDMTGAGDQMPLALLAGNGADTLILRMAGGARVDGGGGADRISGQVAAGKVAGGAEGDMITLTGGPAGASIAVFGGDGADIISLAQYAGPATVSGGAGDDRITALLAVSLTVSGGSGADTMALSGVGSTVNGDSGDDVIRFGLHLTGGEKLALNGSDGNDLITLDAILLGVAAAGNRVFLNGGNGDDRLEGDRMPDLVEQVFVFNSAWGDDRIVNFANGVDVVQFAGTSASGPSHFSDLIVTGDAGATRIDFGSDSIVLEGMARADFDSADVLFV